MNISIGTTLSALRKAKKLMQKDVAAKLSAYGFKVQPKTIYNWEKGLAQPSIPHFIALCDILDIDDVLWQFAGIPKGPYAGLNRSGRQKAKDFIDLLFKIDEFKELTTTGSLGKRSGRNDEDNIVNINNESTTDHEGKSHPTPRLLRLYDIPVSAGAGNFLDDSSFDEIEAPSYVPISVDFALRVSGDSMEPHILDGQVIWVKQAEFVDYGDIL